MKDRFLKVLHVSWSLNTGGLEQVILNLVCPAADYLILPQVAVLEQEGALAAEARAAGAKVHNLGKRPGLDWSMVGRLAGLARREKIDLLHAHNAGAGLYAALAGRLSFRPTVVTRHGKSFETGDKSRLLRRVAGRLARATVCVGRDVMAQASLEDRVPRARLSLIYNGVDVDALGRARALRAEARAELGLPEGLPLVITVARFSPVKDLGVLLEAAAKAAANGADFRLALVGEGPERDSLQEKRDRLGLGERVMFLGRRRDVPRLLAAADIFALSSLSEGISMAVLEAMAAGLPVVGTSVGGMAELVLEGENGRLVPASNPAALAEALAGLAADPRARQAMGEVSRRRAGELFSIQAMNRAYRDVYDRLTGGSG